jgi:hypothetical protein
MLDLSSLEAFASISPDFFFFLGFGFRVHISIFRNLKKYGHFKWMDEQ